MLARFWDHLRKSMIAGMVVLGASSISQCPEPETTWPVTLDATSLACSMRKLPLAFGPDTLVGTLLPYCECASPMTLWWPQKELTWLRLRRPLPNWQLAVMIRPDSGLGFVTASMAFMDAFNRSSSEQTGSASDCSKLLWTWGEPPVGHFQDLFMMPSLDVRHVPNDLEAG